MTQTQICCRIIREHLPWRIVNGEGNEVKKPEGRDELELLLILHKSGIRIESVEPVPNPVTAGLCFGRHDPEKDGYDFTPDELHTNH